MYMGCWSSFPPCPMVLYGALQCSMVLCGALRCSTVLNGALWCSVLYGTLWCSMVLFSALWCSIVLYTRDFSPYVTQRKSYWNELYSAFWLCTVHVQLHVTCTRYMSWNNRFYVQKHVPLPKWKLCLGICHNYRTFTHALEWTSWAINTTPSHWLTRHNLTRMRHWRQTKQHSTSHTAQSAAVICKRKMSALRWGLNPRPFSVLGWVL